MEDKEQYWKVNKKLPKIIALLSFVTLIVYVVFFPRPEKYIDRQRINAIYSILHGLESVVDEQLKNNSNNNTVSLDANKTIPRYIGLTSEKGEDIELTYREITSRGEIKAFSPQLGVMFVLTPRLNNGNVSWSCWGSPVKNLPRECR